MSFSVSVIVCTYNGSTRIEACLSALIAQENAPEYEIIVVDNCSTDNTSDLVKRKLSMFFPKDKWKVIRENNPGLINARITGIKAAKFEHVLFCDDDNLLSSNFLFLGANIFNSNKKIGVLGSLGIPKLEILKPKWFDFYQKSFACGPQNENSGLKSSPLAYVYGASSFFLKKPLLELINLPYKFFLTGRFKGKTISGDDLELCWLMKLMGYEIHYSNRLIFEHFIPFQRLSTDYLIKMKSGTSAGSALLFPYQHYILKQRSKSFIFSIYYFFEFIKAGVIYFKNKIIGIKNFTSWEERLAMSILKARWESFRDNYFLSLLIFKQLKSKKKFWNR